MPAWPERLWKRVLSPDEAAKMNQSVSLKGRISALCRFPRGTFGICASREMGSYPAPWWDDGRSTVT